MSRHRRQFVSLPLSGERQTLGDSLMDEALAKLQRTAQATAAMMAKYDCTRERTLQMLFRDDDLSKLSQVRGMIDTRTDHKAYEIRPKINLHIDFEGAFVPAIEASRVYFHSDRIAPLLNYIDAVKAVHDRFEEVKGVLRWLNRHATPAAIRYYWPSAMKLVPKSPIWADLQEVPSRYTTPDGISDWLQSLKDAAATVASSLLLPDTARPNPASQMKLTFEVIRVDVGNNHYSTDLMTYHI